MPTTAIGYARISRDDTLEGRGVERQEADVRALCKRKRWKLLEVVVDNDVSASRYSRKKRPGYTRLIELIAAGAVQRAVVYDLDRLLRQPRELEDLIDVVEQVANGFELVSLNGDLNLTSSDGRFIARMLIGKAAKESDDASRRIRRANDAKALDGRPHGSSRAFGYASDGVTIIDVEAELLRRAAADVLAGETLNGIARQWNAAGICTPQQSRQWSGTVVRAVLINPRQAGLRVHRGEVVGKGRWKPIVDRATHDRLVKLLTDPSRRRKLPPRRTPFTALIREAESGLPMTRDVVRGRPTYRAGKRPGRESVRYLGIAAEPLEAAIVEAVMTAVDGPALRKRLQRPKRKQRSPVVDPAALEGELRELADDYGDGRITRAEWMVARAGVEKRLAAARALDEQRIDVALAPYIEGASLRESWGGLSPDRQGAILRAVVDRVLIHPSAKRGGPGIDPERVEIVWRV